MTIGEVIRSKRIQLKMSQEELASKLGKSKNVISNWERGDNSPDVNMIVLLCGILNVTPNQLMGWEEKKESDEEIKTIAAHATEDLTEEEREKLLEFAKFIKSQRK